MDRLDWLVVVIGVLLILAGALFWVLTRFVAEAGIVPSYLADGLPAACALTAGFTLGLVILGDRERPRQPVRRVFTRRSRNAYGWFVFPAVFLMAAGMVCWIFRLGAGLGGPENRAVGLAGSLGGWHLWFLLPVAILFPLFSFVALKGAARHSPVPRTSTWRSARFRRKEPEKLWRRRRLIPSATSAGAFLIAFGLFLWAYLCFAAESLPRYWDLGMPGVYALIPGTIVGLGVLVFCKRFTLSALLLTSFLAGGIGTAGDWLNWQKTCQIPVGLEAESPGLSRELHLSECGRSWLPDGTVLSGFQEDLRLVNDGLVAALSALREVRSPTFQAVSGMAPDGDEAVFLKVHLHADRRLAELARCVSAFLRRTQMLRLSQKRLLTQGNRWELAYRAAWQLRASLEAPFGRAAALSAIRGIRERTTDPDLSLACLRVLDPAARPATEADWKEEALSFAEGLRGDALAEAQSGEEHLAVRHLQIAWKLAERAGVEPTAREWAELFLPLAKLTWDVGDLAAAEQFYGRAVLILEKSRRKCDRLRLADAFIEWGALNQALDKQERAEGLHAKAVAILSQFAAPVTSQPRSRELEVDDEPAASSDSAAEPLVGM